MSKGKLVGLSSTNAKTEYKPADVKSFKIDGDKYVSYSNDFYKEIVSGNKAGLYQKVSDNSYEKIYNGPEQVGFLKTTDGKVGDYYIHLANEKEFTKARDALSRERRELPWVKVEKAYTFDGPDGKESLADLFGTRSQL